MGSFLLRQANTDDAQRIAQVQVTTWQSAYLGMIPDGYLGSLSIDRRAQNWVKILESATTGNQTIVAEMDGVVVGFIGIGRSRESEETGLGEVFSIYVEPNFQSRGIGSKLMQAGIALLKDQGLNGAVLWVLDQNIRTRAWYESHGWQSNGKSKTDKRDDFELLEYQYIIDF